MGKWKTWLGIAVSITAIAIAVRGVEWSEVWPALARADRGILALIFVLSPIVNISVRALRWKIFLRPAARISLSGATSATAIGLMANNVLPARVGEFVRAYALGRRERVPVTTAFGGLFLERLFDGLAVVGILYAVTWMHDFPDWVATTVRVAFYLFLGALLFLFALMVRPAATVRLARRVTGRLTGARLEDAVERFLATLLDGFQLLRKPPLVLVSFILALFQWCLLTGLYWLGLVAFGIVDGVGWVGAFFVNCVATLGVAVPSSPGFVGTFEAFIVKSLEVFAVDRTLAFTYAAGFHAVSFIPTTLVGLAYFLRTGLSWGELERSEEHVEEELEEEFEEEIAGDLPEGDNIGGSA
ncbi:MAG: lysylphosphatidylglycerol synthase transmembrane domain-containing protein [Gemmatimonadota bacterium]